MKHSKTHKNWKLRDLRFRISRAEIPLVLKAAGIVILLGKLFYDSVIAMVLLLPVGILLFQKDRALAEKKRVRMCGIRFKDAILSVAASQRAGYSAENAFGEAVHDMALLYGHDADIVTELTHITKGLRNNRTLEELLLSYAQRTRHPDILEFAEVFAIAKRNGGNMTRIIADTAEVIADKIETERQIHVIIAAKRLEAQLMEAVPLFIIFYVGATNRGFFTPLYHNVVGYLVMSAALFVYVCAYLMTEKIIAIEV